MIKKYLVSFVSLVLIVSPSLVSADVFIARFKYDDAAKHLDFNQTLDSDTVSISKDKNISIRDFFQDDGEGLFEIAFFDKAGLEILKKRFSPLGKEFVLEIPYLSIAQTMRVYKEGSGESILSYDLSQFVSCNSNGICEYEKGENLDTCLSDCTGTSITFSDETKSLLNKNNGIVRDPNTGSILLNDLRTTDTSQNAPTGENTQPSTKPFWLTILFVVGLAGAAGAAVYFILRREE